MGLGHGQRAMHSGMFVSESHRNTKRSRLRDSTTTSSQCAAVVEKSKVGYMIGNKGYKQETEGR